MSDSIIELVTESITNESIQSPSPLHSQSFPAILALCGGVGSDIECAKDSISSTLKSEHQSLSEELFGSTESHSSFHPPLVLAKFSTSSTISSEPAKLVLPSET